jgi:hypothetical protein
VGKYDRPQNIRRPNRNSKGEPPAPEYRSGSLSLHHYSLYMRTEWLQTKTTFVILWIYFVKAFLVVFHCSVIYMLISDYCRANRRQESAVYQDNSVQNIVTYV